jgi:hypothetical protein
LPSIGERGFWSAATCRRFPNRRSRQQYRERYPVEYAGRLEKEDFVGEINRKRQDGNLISYFGFTFGKLRRIFHEYRSLFPNKKSSQLHKPSPGSVTLAIVGFYVTRNRKRAGRKSTTQARPSSLSQCCPTHLSGARVRRPVAGFARRATGAPVKPGLSRLDIFSPPSPSGQF